MLNTLKSLVLYMAFCGGLLLADVSSISGTIDFSVVNTGVLARLNNTGLGLGTTSPSSNLHVLGNAIVSQGLSVGTSVATSNLNLGGTLGFSTQSLASSNTLSLHSVYFADTVSSNLFFTLPTASSCSGRMIQVKKSSPANKLFLFSGNGIDGSQLLELATTSNGALPFIAVLSNGSTWYAISQSDNIINYWNSSNIATWYTFNDTVGTTIVDNSGGHNNATASNMAAGNLNAVGLKNSIAVDFDMVNDGIAASASTNIDNIFARGATVSFWMNLSSAGETAASTFVGKGNFNTLGWSIAGRNADVTSSGITFVARFSGNNGTWRAEPAAFPITYGSWAHVVVTYNGSDVANDPVIYLNGVAKTASEPSTPLGTLTDDAGLGLYFGRNNVGSNGMHGKLDEFRIFNRILSADEVRLLYLMDAP